MNRPHEEQRTLGLKPMGVLLLLFTCLSLVSANPLLTLASFGLLLVLVKLFWRSGEPPILLFAMAYHWMQACTLTLNADLQGTPLEQLPEVERLIENAAWLSLIGILVVSLGARLGAGPSRAAEHALAKERSAGNFSIRKLFFACLLAVVLAEVITQLSASAPGLRQPLLALTNIHWVIVFIFTYVVMGRRRGFPYLGIVLAVEVVVGMLGYFSGFKTVLIISILATITTPNAFRGFKLPAILAGGLATVLLFLVWTGIKRDYRAFLNMGTGDQVVLVPMQDRIVKFVDLTLDLDADKMGQSVEDFADRITYIKYFAKCLDIVPDHIPHENGDLWLGAIENALVPRLLNPDKRILDDSARTSYYTGGYVSGVQEGASISLGYVAESYIDFGRFFMVVPLFLWGLFLGWVHRVLIRSTQNQIYNFGCVTALIFLNGSLLESSNVKMVGGALMGFLVMLLFNRFASSHLLRWLAGPHSAQPGASVRSGYSTPSLSGTE